MKIFQIELPREVPGIYKITHSTTNKCYVGSTGNLRRRLRQWQCEFYNNDINAKRIKEANGVTSDGGWGFIVVEELPGADAVFLTQREGVHIVNEVRQNRVVLNSVLTLAAKVHKDAMTEIFNDNGTPMTYEDAAILAGYTNVDSLKQKLARMRKKGITKVNISDVRNPGRGRPKKS